MPVEGLKKNLKNQRSLKIYITSMCCVSRKLTWGESSTGVGLSLAALELRLAATAPAPLCVNFQIVTFTAPAYPVLSPLLHWCSVQLLRMTSNIAKTIARQQEKYETTWLLYCDGQIADRQPLFTELRPGPFTKLTSNSVLLRRGI
jgi:hypothetical protein